MHGDPTPDADTKRGNLSVTHPDSGFTLHSPAIYTVTGQQNDQCLFQKTKIGVKVLTKKLQIEHWISYELAWTMISCLTSAVGPVNGVGEMGFHA
jgi:hypothetical protein